MQRTVIITGGTKGIGRAIALALAPQPYNLVLGYHSDDRSAAEALALCRAITPDVVVARGDVARRQDVAALIDAAIAAFGTVDVLINNAGINIDKPLGELTDEDWDRVVDVNMKGVFLCSQLAAARMLEQGRGGIILNVGASTAIRGRTNGLNYCAAKAGVLTMTKCLALELAPTIRVNCLIPGVTRTDELIHRYRLDDPATLRAVEQGIPLRRVAAPEEMAGVVSFLLSEEARYITGQKFLVDGGQYMF